VTLHNPDPLELEPRPCTLCGLRIDRHHVIDDGDGPEFFCLPTEALTLQELERRAELVIRIEAAAIVARLELADPRDRWRQTGEPAPAPEIRNGPLVTSSQVRTSPHVPQPTLEAFRHLVAAGDVGHLKAWLADHPKDAPFLLSLIESPAS
jgi:hypothetical protein